MAKIGRPNLPGHPDHFVCTDGVIARINPETQRLEAAQTFIGDGDVGEEGVVYVVLPKWIKGGPGIKDKKTGYAHRAAALIGEAFGLPAGHEPGFIDGDPTNLSLTNLAGPDWVAPEQDDVDEQDDDDDDGAEDSETNDTTDSDDGNDDEQETVNPLECPQCGKVCKTPAGVSSHMRAAHKTG